jgi:guanosine-diphosphatase
MSSGVEAPGQRRPGIWSYLSFTGPRRRVSVSLPRTYKPDSDPHEKTTSTGYMSDFKGSAMMNQGQRMRYLKTGGIIAFVLLVLYFVAPRDGLSRGV